MQIHIIFCKTSGGYTERLPLPDIFSPIDESEYYRRPVIPTNQVGYILTHFFVFVNSFFIFYNSGINAKSRQEASTADRAVFIIQRKYFRT